MRRASLAVILARPPIKWVGGKTQLLPELHKHVPQKFKYYFEPFMGGGALFFSLVATGRLGDAVLSDSNQRLIACYRGLRDDLPHAHRYLLQHAHAYAARGADYYLAVREGFNRGDRAARDAFVAADVIFLNKTGFNGLWRENKKGGYNVPPGKFKTPPTICDEANLRAVSAALQNVTLAHADFTVHGSVNPMPGDFVYFDPPYWPASSTADFTAYTRTAFGPAAQERLRDYALLLKKHRVHVLLSNADVPPVRALYAKGFEMRRVEARRNVNSDASKRGAVGELIIW